MKKLYKGGDPRQNYQGDISIISITDIPKGLNFKKLSEEFVVAEGESTGHKHTLVRGRADVELAKDTNGFYLKVNSGEVVLTHQEHETQTIPQGIYFIGRQWEYNDLEERKIQD